MMFTSPLSLHFQRQLLQRAIDLAIFVSIVIGDEPLGRPADPTAEKHMFGFDRNSQQTSPSVSRSTRGIDPNVSTNSLSPRLQSTQSSSCHGRKQNVGLLPVVVEKLFNPLGVLKAQIK